MPRTNSAQWLWRLAAGRVAERGTQPKPRRARLHLETLEARAVPAGGAGFLLSSSLSSVAISRSSGASPLRPTFDLAPAHDTTPLGDHQTTFSVATFVGRTSPGAKVTLKGHRVTADRVGNFTVPNVPLAFGLNRLTVTATKNGATASAGLRVTRVAPPPGVTVLRDQGKFLTEARLPVALGVTEGTRALRFELRAALSPRGTSPTSDLLVVSLVDPETGQPILGGGRPDLPVFTLTEKGPVLTTGLAKYDGTVLEIDVTSIPDVRKGTLLVQLLNHDADGTSEVQVGPVRGTVNRVGEPGPSATSTSPPPRDPGPAASRKGYIPVGGLKLVVENARFDDGANRYTAEVRVQNNSKVAVSRNLVVALAGLPRSVTVANASGRTSSGSPYLNMAPAISSGGLGPGQLSDPVTVVVDNPDRVRFTLKPLFRGTGRNKAPKLVAIPDHAVTVGGKLEVRFGTTDADGDRVTYKLRGGDLPTHQLRADGSVVFSPRPEEVGTYEVTAVATDGSAEVTRRFRLTVASDPIPTTRVSGLILDVSRQPVWGMKVAVGTVEGFSLEDGSFLLDLGSGVPPTETLRVGDVNDLQGYPFIAEKLPLLLEHEVFPSVNNVIGRPIYLPQIDAGVVVDPAEDTPVTNPDLAGARVDIKAGSLFTQLGTLYAGPVSVTEVPIDRTPAALPQGLHPDLVVTIQPGDMNFATPAQLTLPNRAGFEDGTRMTLWSINPSTGEFDVVGDGLVTDDGAGGSVIRTVSGGVRNSSWHFFSATGPGGIGPDEDANNEDCGCNGGGDGAGGDPNGEGDAGGPDSCEAAVGFASEVELHSGAVRERHDLPTYESVGDSRGISLHYNSERADPRPIIHFGFGDTGSTFNDLRLVANLKYGRGEPTVQLPGYFGSHSFLRPGDHIWSIPEGQDRATAALQLDLRDLTTGMVKYEIAARVTRVSNLYLGSDTVWEASLLTVNSIASPFGAGWNIGGWQQVVPNDDGTVLWVDGNGGQLLFRPKAGSAGGNVEYDPPPGDFTTLRRDTDGRFTRTMKNGTVYTFNGHNLLESVTDWNGNQTFYRYTGDRLDKIVDPVGLETVFAYTGGRVTTIQDPAGRKTTLRYDAAGNLIRLTNPDGTFRTWEYDGGHHMTAEIDQRGFREETRYHFSGRAVGALRKDGTEVWVTPAQVRGLYPAGETAEPANSPPAAALRGAEATFTDGNGNVTRYLLDKAGQLVSAIDAVGRRSTVRRDAHNLVVETVDGRGHVTEYGYDDRGNVTSVRETLFEPLSAHSNNLYAERMWTVEPGDGPVGALGAADLNGDGLTDLVFWNRQRESGRPTLFTRLADGMGGFGPDLPAFFDPADPDPINSILGARGDQLRDVTADGIPDIIAFATDGSTPGAVYRGVGDGTFQRAGTIPRGFFEARAWEMFVADVNGDGHADLIENVSLYDENVNIVDAIALRSGDGTGNFAPPVFLDLGGRLEGVRDLDGDGNLDLVTEDEGTYTVSFGDGLGGIDREQALLPLNEFVGQNKVFFGDVDEDGNDDIYIERLGYSESYSFLYTRTADGAFVLSKSDSIPEYSISSALTDYDRDGHLDLIRAEGLYRGDGTGAFHRTHPPVPGWRVDQVAVVGNTDSDRDPELVSADNGYFRVTDVLPGGRPQVSAHPQDVVAVHAIRDFDKDGNPDLLATDRVGANANGDGGTVRVVLRPGLWTGGFGSSVPIRVLGPEDNAEGAVGNINGDAYPDYAVWAGGRLSDEKAFVYLGNATFDVSPPTEVDLDDPIEGPAIELQDIDADGLDDLVTLSGYGIFVRLNDGQGGFGPVIRTDVEYFDYPSARFADLTGDQIVDVAFPTLGGVKFMRGTGTGDFVDGGTLGTEGGVASVAIGDLDGDGSVDLVATTVGQAKVFKGQVGGTFEERVVWRVQDGGVGFDSPDDVTIADLNRDAFGDLLFHSDGAVFVLYGDADLAYQVSEAYAAGSGGRLMVTDLRNDGAPDVVTGGGSDSPAILENLSSFRPVTVERQYAYESKFNRRTRAENELGHATLYDVDPDNGNLRSVTQVVGGEGQSDDVTWSFDYNARGQVIAATDPLLRETRYVYDDDGPDLGRLTAVTTSVGTESASTTGYGYDLAGNVASVTNARGFRTTFEYDSMNRLVKTTEADPDGPGQPLPSPVTVAGYDAAGNRTSVRNPEGRVTQFQYDRLGRLERVVYPDPDEGGPQRAPEDVLGYDRNGNLVFERDPAGMTTTYAYDPRNQRVAATDARGGLTTFRYDPNDNLVVLTDPGGNRTEFQYDARDRLIAEVDPLGHARLYRYDGADQLVLKTDRNHRVTSLAYDDLGRLIAEEWVGAGIRFDYSYDGVGNLRMAAGNQSGLAFEYDDQDRVRLASNAGTANTPLVEIAYRYDETGNIRSVTDTISGSGGATTEYQYDGLDRLIRLTQSGPAAASKRVDFAYNRIGQYAKVSRFSDLDELSSVADTVYAYDGMNRLKSLSHRQGNTNLSGYTYSYESDSRISQIVSAQDGIVDYGYDDLSQLTAATYHSDPTLNERYAYDGNGNRVESHRHPTGYVTDPSTANQLKSDGTFDYEYDSEGNLISRTRTTTGETRDFRWDGRNRLTAVTDSLGGSIIQEVTFAYDALNRRISKTLNGAATLLFVYDHEDVLLDLTDPDASGSVPATVSARYLHGAAIDEVLAEDHGSGDVRWLLSDHLGTTRDIVSNDGQPLTHLVADAYGNVITESNSLFGTRYLFTGRELDTETGMYYQRSRYYISDVGRFSRTDPISFLSGDFNLFRYVGNDPINHFDSFGLAQLCHRPMRGDGFSDPLWQALADLFNLGLRGQLADHHQFRFRDGRNAGFHGLEPDPKTGDKRVWGTDAQSDDYICDSEELDETDLARAINSVPHWPYNLYDWTCQDWAAEVLRRYREIHGATGLYPATE